MRKLVQALRLIVPNYSNEMLIQYALLHGKIRSGELQSYLDTYTKTCLDCLGIDYKGNTEEQNLYLILVLMNMFDVNLYEAYSIVSHSSQESISELRNHFAEIKYNVFNNADECILQEIVGTSNGNLIDVDYFINAMHEKIQIETKMNLPAKKRLVNNT